MLESRLPRLKCWFIVRDSVKKRPKTEILITLLMMKMEAALDAFQMTTTLTVMLKMTHL